MKLFDLSFGFSNLICSCKSKALGTSDLMHTRLTSQGKWMRRVDVGLVTVELFVKMFLSFQMMCTEGKSLNDSTRRWLQMIWLSSKSLHPSERQSWFSVDYVRTPAGHYRWFNTLYQAHIQVSRGLDFMRTLCASPTNAFLEYYLHIHRQKAPSMSLAVTGVQQFRDSEECHQGEHQE